MAAYTFPSYSHHHLPLLCPSSPSLILPFIMPSPVAPLSFFFPLLPQEPAFLLTAAAWSGSLLPGVMRADPGLRGTGR